MLSNLNKSFGAKLSPNKDKGDNISLINYLNEKLRILEIENNQLRTDILHKHSDKEVIEYYQRLRRELVEEIERFKGDRITLDLNYNNEIEKLKQENKVINEQLERERQKNILAIRSDEDLFSTQFSGKSPSKRYRNKYFPNEGDGMSQFSEDVLQSSPNVGTNDSLFMKSVKKDKEGLYNHSHNNIIEENNLNNNLNSFLPIITEMEERIKKYEDLLAEKDKELENIKFNKFDDKNKINREMDEVKRECESWKQKYHSVLSCNKTMSDEFFEMVKKEKDVNSNQINDTIYDLEKKALYLEKTNKKFEDDVKKVVKMSKDIENVKQGEIDNLKNSIKLILENYETLHKSYNDNLNETIKQIDLLKQLYISREKEFVSLTSYYVDSLNDYTHPLNDVMNKESYVYLKDIYVKQVKEIDNLKKDIEKNINEYSKLKQDFLESKPKIRQRTEEAVKQYKERLKKISKTHMDIQNQLEVLNNFIGFFDEKFHFFNTLIEDKKNMEVKYNHLEAHLKNLDFETKEEEIIKIKDINYNLNKELEIKINTIKELEILVEKQSSALNRDKKQTVKYVSEDFVNKLKSENAVLTSQIFTLKKANNDIEKFYTEEINKRLTTIKNKNKTIEELKTNISKMEKEVSGKKERIYNVWRLEFMDFRDKILTIANIRAMIEKFRIDGDELNIFKDVILDEEFILLKEEMKFKDELYKQSHDAFDGERDNLLGLIDNYKSTLNDKIFCYDKMIEEKRKELEAISKEKERFFNLSSLRHMVNYIN
jgi:hypothetical protein